MKNENKPPFVDNVVFKWLSLLAAIIGVAAFYITFILGHPTLKSWRDVANKEKPANSSEKLDTKDTIKESLAAPLLSSENNDSTILSSHIETFQSQEYIERDSIKNFKVVTSENPHGNYGSSIPIEISETPPHSYKGKVAIRLNCDFCYGFFGVDILTPDSLPVEDIKAPRSIIRYNPTFKKATTYMAELDTGNYIFSIDFDLFGGKKYLQTEIKEGEILLYDYYKNNPFGKGYGAVSFTSRQNVRIKLTIDGIFQGEVSLRDSKEVIIKLNEGIHKIFVEKSNSTTLDEGKKLQTRILEGGKIQYTL